MALSPGARVGSYEIQAVVGSGGMGQVYRARDTRLDRTVAIKVLHAHLSDRADARERFQREAHAISNLNHPHICALYDVGSQDGVDYLVMEYLKGETLASRLQRGPLPVAEALEIAAQIADAIDKAHRQGVIHRDLKPGNVMLTVSGPKLLDFGLARQGRPVGATSESALPTVPSALTAEGTILGTLQYMAPEQLEGKEADARTDIFAFGTVLHEMLTGRKAFDGKSHASVIAAIVDRDPPPVSSLAPLSPPLLDDVVKTCLAKDPDKRWQSMADVLIGLRMTSESHTEVSAPETRRRSWIARAAITVVLVVGALLAAGIVFRPSSPNPAKIMFDLQTPPARGGNQFAISPTGSHVAALVATPDSARRIWLHSLADLKAGDLAGTDRATFPFWSPDGRSIAFFADDKLKAADLTGAPVRTVCPAPQGRGGTWSRENVVVFASQGILFRVPARGGDPVQVTRLDPSRREISHSHPFLLPDGRHFLYLAVSEKAENCAIYIGSLDSQERKFLVAANVKAQFAAPDYVLFVRDNSLMAYRFDPTRLQVKDDPFPVADNVGTNQDNGAAGFSVSGDGTLVLRFESADNVAERFPGRLEWFDRSGHQTETAWTGMRHAVIARDLQHVAAVMKQADKGSDIWILDVARDTRTRFTFDAAIDDAPIWSPKSDRIVFRSNRSSQFDLYEKEVGSTRPERPLLESNHPKTPLDWSADGRFILYQDDDPQTGPDLWVLPTTDPKKPSPVVRSQFAEFQGRFSPDGHYIAYVSNESGTAQVFVQEFPAGKRSQISADRGHLPRWRYDGKELFFLSGTPTSPYVMAVDLPISAEGALRPGVPHKLFEIPSAVPLADTRLWDVTPDGQRFLLHTLPPEDSTAAPLRVILNWASGTSSTPPGGR